MAEAISSLLIGALAASGVHVAVGVDSEVAAGVAPAVIGQSAEPVQALRLAPLTGLKLGSEHHSLAVSYAPRFFWRRPDLGSLQSADATPTDGQSSPAAEVSDVQTGALLLNRGQLQHAVQWAPSLRMLTTATFSVGEVNYNAAQDLLAANRGQSRVVRNLVVDLYRYEGQSSFEYASDALTLWTLSLLGEATGPRGQSAQSARDILQTSRSLGLTLSWARQFTRRDQLTLSGQMALQVLEGTGNYVMAQPEVGYTRRISQGTDVNVTVGAVLLSRVGLPDPSAQIDELAIGVAEPPAVNATGNVRLQSELYKKRGVVIATEVGGGLDWFLDPIVGKFFPTFTVDAGFDIDVGRRWQFNPAVSFFTILDRQPTEEQALALRGTEFLVGYDPTDPSDSTRLGWELPVRYRMSPGIYLNGGTRAALRTRRLTSPNFSLSEQVEFWAYLGLTVQLSTEPHGDEDWLYKPEDNATKADDR